MVGRSMKMVSPHHLCSATGINLQPQIPALGASQKSGFLSLVMAGSYRNRVHGKKDGLPAWGRQARNRGKRDAAFLLFW